MRVSDWYETPTAPKAVKVRVHRGHALKGSSEIRELNPVVLAVMEAEPDAADVRVGALRIAWSVKDRRDRLVMFIPLPVQMWLDAFEEGGDMWPGRDVVFDLHHNPLADPQRRPSEKARSEAPSVVAVRDARERMGLPLTPPEPIRRPVELPPPVRRGLDDVPVRGGLFG